MQQSDNWYIAAITGLITGFIFASAAWIFSDISVANVVYGGIIAGLSAGIVIKLTFHFFLNRRIRKLIKAINNFSDNGKGSALKADVGQGDLKALEKCIHHLINEKSGEIERLKELEQYRRQFLGNVAHELRTPIFSIQGYIHTLKDGALYDENVNYNFINKAAKNADHLTNLIEDLMTISRIESGKHALERTNFDITALIRETFESLEWMAEERDIKMEIRPSGSGNFLVNADKEMIRQVLENLITNSIKYGRKGGQTIVKLYDTEKLIKTDVTDNGEGIAKEDMQRIFERFYRVDKSRSKKQGGSGLGLAIVKHFIEAHGRKIHVNSSPGIGSTFSFNLEKGSK